MKLKQITIATFFLTGLASSVAAQDCTPDQSLVQENHRIIVRAADQFHVHTDMVIDAPANKVWQVLSDFSAMSKWSSSLQDVKGKITDGSPVTVHFQMRDNLVEISQRLKYEEGISFGWSKNMGIAPGIIDFHDYRIEPISSCQTRFIQTALFSGSSEKAPQFTSEKFANRVLPVYRRFNAELKEAVEGQKK